MKVCCGRCNFHFDSDTNFIIKEAGTGYDSFNKRAFHWYSGYAKCPECGEENPHFLMK